MYNIAICDKDSSVCLKMENGLYKIANKINLQFEIEIFINENEFYQKLKNKNHFDIIFIDTKLNKISGFEIGYKIRTILDDFNVLIIYVSSDKNHIFHLLETQPFDFLVKPIEFSSLFSAIKRATKYLERKNTIFEFCFGKEIFRIPYNEILYFKSEGRKVQIVLYNRSMEFYCKLKNISHNTPSYFLSIHKSYLINHNYIIKYSYDCVKMKNNDILTISRSYQKHIREKIFQLMGQNKRI